MTRLWRPVISVGVVLAAVLTATTSSLATVASPGARVPLESAEVDLVVEYAPNAPLAPTDPIVVSSIESLDAALRIGTPGPAIALPGLNALAAGVTVSYDPTYPSPANVQEVIEAAVTNWTNVLNTRSAPIQIEVLWYPFGNTSILGSAGFTTAYRGGSLPADRFVPAPLANVLTGSDLNGADAVEIQVILNASMGTRWFISPGGAPSTSQIDLYSVVLHEMGHGFGFVGSARSLNGAPPDFPAVPLAYDDRVFYGAQPVLSVAGPAAALTSNELSFDLGTGTRHKLYAPATWQQGSSYSHFDEATYSGGAPGALMTPALRNGEVQRTLDSAVTAVLSQIGWTLTIAPPIRATIGGRLTDQTGGLVADVAVDLFRAAADGSRASWLGDARSGADGRFSLTVDPGCYVLTFIAPVGASFLGTGQYRNVPVCVGSGENSSANDVSLIVAAAGARIQGTVIAADGSPAPRVLVDLFAANGDGSRALFLGQRSTADNGTYSFEQALGCYVLVFVSPDGAEWVGGNKYRQVGTCVTSPGGVATIDAALRIP
jgi:5-hydroxyisourate hydrolase-like protein (transthyretin family)